MDDGSGNPGVCFKCRDEFMRPHRWALRAECLHLALMLGAAAAQARMVEGLEGYHDDGHADDTEGD